MEFIDPFPLLRLPMDSRMNVLRNMEILRFKLAFPPSFMSYIFRMGFSLLSKSAKHLIKSLNLKADEVVVQAHELCVLSVKFKGQFIQFGFASKRDLRRGRIRPRFDQVIPTAKILVFYNTVKDDHHWNQPEFTARDWFEHFCSVFHRSKIDYISVNRPTININSMKEAVKGLEVLKILFRPDSTNQYTQEVLQTFPKVTSLHFHRNFFGTVTKTHQCFIQNLYQLVFVDGIPITLNDLLVINSTHIFVKGTNWTEQTLNQFLKLWRLGSCPYLEHFSITLVNNQEGLNKEVVLKGLKSMEMGETVRFFDRWDMEDERGRRPRKQKVEKGIDIWRHNGTCATIVLEKWSHHSSFKFFVWS
ncbi:hypothetical protein CAEBREN_17594 [Caenorhabditis brenneri]|uniref:Sdz-33 F-box domain-containing protein n=1 Tax=Caenorhabditis brenneri TaxID=135651 RepID=G0N3H5_CAEBE|nr:hypothetical protein CAEBREN_17594 [Caenorhabditis brenneri]